MLSDILFGILADILSDIILTFYLAFYLTYCVFRHPICHSFWHLFGSVPAGSVCAQTEQIERELTTSFWSGIALLERATPHLVPTVTTSWHEEKNGGARKGRSKELHHVAPLIKSREALTWLVG